MTRTALLLANATRDLARFAAGLQFDDIPPNVVGYAKLCVLDRLDVALFGAGLPWTRHGRELALAEGATLGPSRLDRASCPGQRLCRPRVRDG